MSVESDRATQKMAVMATRMANRRMRSEILPDLQGPIPRQLYRSWNPLLLDSAQPFILKLRISDILVKQVLQSNKLTVRVNEIINQSVAAAIVDNSSIENTPYLAAAIRDLFRD